MSIRLGDVIDWTEEINNIESKEKTLAFAILNKYFDVEQVPVSDRVKHYPISTSIALSEDEEENAALRSYSLERLSKKLWEQVLNMIGCVDLTKNQKVGKLIYCSSNRFQYCNKENEPFKIYCFEYANEIKAEINFTIEFY